MPTIFLTKEKKVISCSKGEKLYSILAKEGLLDAPCGGKGICGKCYVLVDGISVRSCSYAVTQDIHVTLPEKTKASAILSGGSHKDFKQDHFEPETYGIAIDIGTTTVVSSLIELSTGKDLGSVSCLNSQRIYGQDVMSRITFAAAASDGTLLLQELIETDLSVSINELISIHKIDKNRIVKMSIAGNTTMIHLLAGISPVSIGKAPYLPAFTGPFKTTAGDLSLPALDTCEVYCIPAISSFVGGDITAGVLACGFYGKQEKKLLLDIGTNGELVLSNEGTFFCCSCAAGPALEGMNILFGMRAAEGAIEDVRIEDGKVVYVTIGKANPVGLCGSGILSAITQLRKAGILDDSGRLLEHPLIQEIENERCFVIEQESLIRLTQRDIRQVQLAKGALLSGILALLEACKMPLMDLDEVVVAGQFGTHLKTESLIGSGILPQAWKDRITYAGNTSKAGAYLCLLSEKERNEAELISDKITYIELSTLKDYEDLYLDCLSFE